MRNRNRRYDRAAIALAAYPIDDVRPLLSATDSNEITFSRVMTKLGRNLESDVRPITQTWRPGNIAFA